MLSRKVTHTNYIKLWQFLSTLQLLLIKKIFSGHLHVYYIPNLRCNSNMEDSNSCCLDNKFSRSSVNDVICAKTEKKISIEIFRCHVTWVQLCCRFKFSDFYLLHQMIFLFEYTFFLTTWTLDCSSIQWNMSKKNLLS